MRALVATDLSDAADVALREGVAMTPASADALAVVHVVPILPRESQFFPARDDVLAAKADEVIALARSATRGRVAGIVPKRTEIFVDEGIDYAKIVERAQAFRADVIILGSHGRSGLSRVLGGVAEKVVRSAHCSVLVARPTTGRGCVLAATDLSDPSLTALGVAAAWAARRGAMMEVVHATGLLEHELHYLMQIAPSLSSSGRDPEADTLPAMLREFVAKAGVHVTCEELEGAAAPAIVREAERARADLVVVGTHGRTGLARLALGSVAEKVVRAAPCSVLVVRKAREDAKPHVAGAAV